jgi:hypothetical protein
MVSPARKRAVACAGWSRSMLEMVSAAATSGRLATIGQRRKLPARSSSRSSSSISLRSAGSPRHAWSRNVCLAAGSNSSASANNLSADCLGCPMNTHSTNGEHEFPVVSYQLSSNGDSGETGKWGRKEVPSMYSIRGPHRVAPKDGGGCLDGVIITRGVAVTVAIPI